MKTAMTLSKISSPSFLAIIFITFTLVACRESQKTKHDGDVVEGNVNADGFESIFDGETLNGWEGDTTYWRAEDGKLVGEITPETLLKKNTFVIWRGGEPADFELKTDFRISVKGNSGINYRSELLDTVPFALRGYQADIDGQNRYTGQNYEERKRTTLAYRGEKAEISAQENANEPGSLRANVKNNAWQSREILASLGDKDSLKTKINTTGWNEAHLVLRGNTMKHYINGILMSEVIDNDSINREPSGKLGMQVHVGPPMRVEYRNIRLKEL